VLGTLADECAGRGSGVLFVLLPSKLDVEDDDAATADDVLAALQVTREDFALNLALTREVGEALAARGLAVADATPPLRAAGEHTERPMFWRRDHHLSTTGHFVVAQWLALQIAQRRLMPGSESH